MPVPIRRYLDHAATGWPKPAAVIDAWRRAAVDGGATAGRGAYRSALEATAIRERARTAVAGLLGAAPQRVVLTAGATVALNTALHGLLQPGDHVIATAADHNATLRPLEWLRSRGMIDLSIVPCGGTGRVDPRAVRLAWRPATRLVACAWVSNVTGVQQDVAGLAEVVRGHEGLLLLDAAQAAGLEALANATALADIMAGPGHKWLHGPAGTGWLWLREGLEPEPLIQGGTGSGSDCLDMPAALVERLEAGSPDVPALAGLAAGIDWLDRHGRAAVAAHVRGLAATCAAALADLPGVRVLAPTLAAAPIVSFTVEGYDPAEVAAILEQVAGVEVRAGFHCAALIHRHLGTSAGGTVRASFGPFNGPTDAAAVVAAVAALTGAGATPVAFPESDSLQPRPPWQM
jgi:cysteine desulfurase/selenocysteine lyase